MNVSCTITTNQNVGKKGFRGDRRKRKERAQKTVLGKCFPQSRRRERFEIKGGGGGGGGWSKQRFRWAPSPSVRLSILAPVIPKRAAPPSTPATCAPRRNLNGGRRDKRESKRKRRDGGLRSWRSKSVRRHDSLEGKEPKKGEDNSFHSLASRRKYFRAVLGHRMATSKLQRSPALERLHPFQAHPHAQHQKTTFLTTPHYEHLSNT